MWSVIAIGIATALAFHRNQVAVTFDQLTYHTVTLGSMF